MLNKFVCMGRLTKDPELRLTPSGVSVATFTIAVDRDFKDQNGEKQTDFLNVVAWRQTANFIANHFSKGRMICIEGSVQTRSYEKDGQKRYVTEIVAEKAHFTGEPKKDGQGNTETNAYTPPAGFVNTDDEEIPF